MFHVIHVSPSPLLSNSIALMLYFYIMFSSIPHPCASKKYFVHSICGIISSYPISYLSVKIVVFRFFSLIYWVFNPIHYCPLRFYLRYSPTCCHVRRMTRQPTIWLRSRHWPKGLAVASSSVSDLQASSIVYYSCPHPDYAPMSLEMIFPSVRPFCTKYEWTVVVPPHYGTLAYVFCRVALVHFHL